MNKRERKKIYQRLVHSTTGVWNKEDGLAYQEELRANGTTKACRVITY